MQHEVKAEFTLRLNLISVNWADRLMGVDRDTAMPFPLPA